LFRFHIKLFENGVHTWCASAQDLLLRDAKYPEEMSPERHFHGRWFQRTGRHSEVAIAWCPFPLQREKPVKSQALLKILFQRVAQRKAPFLKNPQKHALRKILLLEEIQVKSAPQRTPFLKS
jgi:hypothetical protein